MPESVVLEERRAQDAGAPRGGAAVELAVYDRLDDISSEWRQFEQTADCTAFQTFDWLDAWCRHIGSLSRTRPAIVVGRAGSGTPLFLIPLAVTPGVINRLTFLGTDNCDYNGPLLAPDFSTRMSPENFVTVWRDICRLLQRSPHHRHDLIEFTKLPERVGTQRNPFLAMPVAMNPSNAYVADLFAPWNSYYETKRSSATRRRDRTKLKRLGEIGEVRFVTPTDRAEIERTMDVLVAQKSKSLMRMGAPDIFARPGWRAFYTALATDPHLRQFVHVSRLDVGTIWSATNLGLTFGDTYYHVLASYDDGETARFGPGVAHLRHLMELAIERDLTRFDFTIGDERYKREWSDHTLMLYDHVAAASARGWPAAAMIHGHRRLKRFIKQNEVLWAAFSRARAALGGNRAAPAESADEGATVRPSPPLAPQ
jgi:CelD/BcsL family acetyltransferase involved in cellulose biosynthesis